MEKALENKAKFFAQYWGQSGIARDKMLFVANVSDVCKMPFVNNYTLWLKPISSITDEDAIEVANFMGFSMTNVIEARALILILFVIPTNDIIKYEMFLKQMLFDLSDLSSTVEKIRSLGYAYKWLGVSVEQQIEYGWVKLEEK